MSGKTSADLMTIKEDNEPLIEDIRSKGIFTISSHGTRGMSRTASPNRKIVNDTEIEQAQKFAGFGLEITSAVVGSLISHPCIVLRRQCQVNRKAAKYHINPITLLPIIIKIQRRQGFGTLWKGAGGVFILRGCAVALETTIAEFTPFPREISVNSSIRQLAEHLMLKSITLALLTPFYCASLVETVQSDIASEKPGVLDCLKEGLRRLFRWGTPQSTRLLPVWWLLGPTAAHGLLHYIVTSLINSVTLWFLSLRLQREQERVGTIPKSQVAALTKYLNELTATFFGNVVADVLLFPAETVLHRLYLQGTRTIVDNLDSGISVLPVITKYEGAIDCFQTIVQEEGASGLYKGFGALIFQYALNALILKITKIVFQEIVFVFRRSKSQSVQL